MVGKIPEECENRSRSLAQKMRGLTISDESKYLKKVLLLLSLLSLRRY